MGKQYSWHMEKITGNERKKLLRILEYEAWVVLWHTTKKMEVIRFCGGISGGG